MIGHFSYKMDAPMESLLSSVKAPINNEKIYKEECMYCFDTPVSTRLYRSPYYISFYPVCVG